MKKENKEKMLNACFDTSMDIADTSNIVSTIGIGASAVTYLLGKRKAMKIALITTLAAVTIEKVSTIICNSLMGSIPEIEIDDSDLAEEFEDVKTMNNTVD